MGKAADLLAKAEQPVIFVGGGANEAAVEVRALAEHLTAPPRKGSRNGLLVGRS
jgi:thiamine pyrophosphate-dependent acetolactate synthase large subunit-like protein